jgi:hypothetical protein
MGAVLRPPAAFRPGVPSVPNLARRAGGLKQALTKTAADESSIKPRVRRSRSSIDSIWGERSQRHPTTRPPTYGSRSTIRLPFFCSQKSANHSATHAAQISCTPAPGQREVAASLAWNSLNSGSAQTPGP